MKQTLTLEAFPDPKLARALSPNGRVSHWAASRAKQRVGVIVLVEATRQQLRPMRAPVVMWLTFVFPVARKRDDDNYATGVVKRARDCLVEMGILSADDSDALRQERVEFVVERGRRALVIELEEVMR